MCEEILNSEFLVVMAAVQKKKLSLNFLWRRVRFLAINKDICCQMRLLTVRCTTIKFKSQSNTTINEFVRD